VVATSTGLRCWAPNFCNLASEFSAVVHPATSRRRGKNFGLRFFQPTDGVEALHLCGVAAVAGRVRRAIHGLAQQHLPVRCHPRRRRPSPRQVADANELELRTTPPVGTDLDRNGATVAVEPLSGSRLGDHKRAGGLTS